MLLKTPEPNRTKCIRVQRFDWLKHHKNRCSYVKCIHNVHETIGYCMNEIIVNGVMWLQQKSKTAINNCFILTIQMLLLFLFLQGWNVCKCVWDVRMLSIIYIMVKYLFFSWHSIWNVFPLNFISTKRLLRCCSVCSFDKIGFCFVRF